jgi:diguanylate cyclase (GGDEF)-like protein
MAALAGDWLRGVAAAGFVPGVRARARAALRDLLEEFVAAVRAEPFDPAPGHRIGTDLVDLRMSAPPVIGTTVHLLAGRLPAMLGDQAYVRTRILDLLECLATGFVAAQRDAAVRAAEEMNRAEKIHWRTVQTDLQRQLQQALLHRPDTGLPNEQHLRERLAAETGGRLGLCLLSVDRFAEFTDALGHDHGTRLLTAVAYRLGGGTFLAHLGDDQFALLVTGTAGADDVVKVADRARRMLAAAIPIDGHALRVTVTAGVVEGPAAGVEPGTWLHDARAALSWAHQDQRALAVFDPGRAAADLRRHQLAAAMPAALERGEFQLHYQPLHRLADRAVIGVEALARWQRPGSAEPLAPAHFITLAERTGLIRPLGRLLLEQACRQGAAWRRAGHDLLISVNLSPLQLGDPALPADVADLLHRTGLPAGRLQLEITETAAIVEHRDALTRLAGLGVRLALDDFGTGYSSLAALSTLPFTDAKLAAEFLADPPTEALRHTISLCHALGMTVTAEGIETAGHEQTLRDLGCDHGQGYLFARPVPAAGVTRLLG